MKILSPESGFTSAQLLTLALQSGLLFLVAAYTYTTFGGISAFVFPARRHVLAKQEANSWRKLRESFRELPLPVNTFLHFCVFC